MGGHTGAHFYTIGQRKGLGVGGRAEPLFVIGIDTAANVVYVGQGEAHPGLYRRGLRIARDQLHWVCPDPALKPGEEAPYLCRIRYRQPLQEATLRIEADGGYLRFERPQRSVTPGQFAAWYDLRGEELLGSGVIDR